jgi:hypothetical protein
MAPSPNYHEEEFGEDSVLIAGPVEDNHLDKCCGIQDLAQPEIKVVGGKSGPARTLSGNR